MMSSDGASRLVEPLTEREHEVLQLLAQARALGLVAGETQARPRHNLPLQLSSFVGREWELAEVRRLLSASRLVTLTGAGGCGKTRLALQTADAVAADFPDGVWLVELASLSDATLVPQAVAAVFDVREYEGRPILSLLQSYRRQRKLLLVLDNCEHIVEAAAQLAEALVSHCPHLQILATSREALAVAGEDAWLVPTLSLPAPGEPPLLETLMDSDAVRLFVERAAAALPGFSLTEENAAAVEQVCRRLDGIPPAIEFAAARVKLLRVEQISARLNDRFALLTSGSRTALPRHQTLETLIDWSYELLAPAEQRLLRWLSVFAGGFTLDAVEAVCASTEEGDVLGLLTQLVNKSMVVAERETGQEARYRLLETVRQYAGEKLEEAGEAALVRPRCLDFFLQLAEMAEPLLHSGEQLIWLERLEAEHDNLRAALAWSLEGQDGDLESGLRLATALVPFWIMRSHLREGRRWLDPALERRQGAPPPIQARLLCNAGRLWGEQGQADPTALLQESLTLYRQLEDKRGIACSLLWLGHCAKWFRHDPLSATPLLEKGLALARQIEDRLLMTWLYDGLAWTAMDKGDGAQAAELSARGLALARERGDRREKLRLLHILGLNARIQRDYELAPMFFREALELARELKDRFHEAWMLNALGETARVQKAFKQALAYYHESLALYRELDRMGSVTMVLHNLGLLALGRGDRRQALSLFRESMSLAQESNTQIICLWNVWGLARLALADGQARRAAQLFAAARPMMKLTYGVNTADLDDYERDVALARTQLGEEAFAAAWAEGQPMSLEEAVALALEER